MAKGLSAAKAKRILEDGYVKGKPLTAKQKKYFGAIASGATPLKAIDGTGVPKAQLGLANKLYKLVKGAKKFESSIDWAKWNKAIPKNKALMKEYNAIEEATKKNGTWMKNADGSAFNGTPEQFVQENSQNFKTAFPTGFGITTRGDRVHYESMNKGVTFSGDKQVALNYTYDNAQPFTRNSPLGENPNPIGPGIHDSEGLYELYYPKKNNTLKIDGKGRDYSDIPVDDEGLIEYMKGKQVWTDDIAKYIKSKNIDRAVIDNIYDDSLAPGQVIINNNKPGNYLKSIWGNDGMFNMNDPGIYRAIVPGAIGLGAASQMTGPVREDGQFKNGGWLDKFKEGGSLPGASGMMYSRTSGTSPEEPKKAQDGTVMYGTPEYKKAYEEGTFADVPNQLDEVVMYSGVDYEKYPYYNDLSAEQRKYFDDDGPIGRGVRRAAYTKRGLAEDTYDVVNPLMYGMLGLAGGMAAGPSIATLGRATAGPIGRALSYKPFGGPVSIGNTIDVGSAAYAAYATPEAYDKFKENPNFDTGTDLALTAIDLVPFSEIFTGGKNIKKLYNKGKNLFTNDLKPNPNMYYRGIGQSGLDDITESGLLRAKPADKIPFNGMGTKFDFAKRFNNLYVTPRLNVADQYGRGVVAEIPKDVADFSKRYKNSDWSMMTDNQIPIEEVNLYKKNFFGNYKPVNIPQPPLSSMPFSKPNIYPTSSPLLKDMEPYLSRKVYPFNKEQEVFESFLSTDRRLKNIDSKSLYYNQAGKRITKGEADNLLYPPEYQKNGGEVDKAQFGKLLKLVKKYGKKLFNFAEPAAKVDNTPSLKYTDDVDLDMDVFNKKTRDAAAAKKQLETAKENIEQGESWKYKPGELEKLEARSKFLDETLDFPFSDNSSDVYTNLTRYNLSDYLKKGLDKRFGTIGNDYTTGYGHKGLDYKTNYLNDYFKDYRVGLPDGSTVPYGKLDGSVEIDPSLFNSSGEVMEELRRLAQTRMGDQFNNAFEKTSRIDFGDLLKNKNRNGGWLSKYENGGVIEDNRGQLAHPGEITKINSNNITMKGVNYPVLGISDTGDTKMMQPGEDYKFKGNSVTEFPMARDGKSLVALDQLTNFTNYNTPQPGGWLDKY